MAKKRKLTKSRKTKKQFRAEDNQKDTETVQPTRDCTYIAAIDSLWMDARMRILWQTRKTQNQIIHRIAGTAELKKERIDL